MEQKNSDIAKRYLDEANNLSDLRDKLRDAESIAEDVPALADLFNKVRTSGRNGRNGRYVALLDYDEQDGWDCRNVAFLQRGTHYREHGAYLAVSYKPYPFISVEKFREDMAEKISQRVQAARQNAGQFEYNAQISEMQRQYFEQQQEREMIPQ